MPIWIHQNHSSGQFGVDDIARKLCPFCNVILRGWQAIPEVVRNYTCFFLYCRQCGWWTRFVVAEGKLYDGEFIDAHQTFVKSTSREPRKGDKGRKGDPIIVSVVGTCAVLKNLDLRDVSAPISEVRAHLVAKYQDRFNVHWRKFEEVVASVFRDLGYDVVLGAGQNDGGVDVIMSPPNGTQMIGVQVKRYRDKIEVEQIRGFLGALIDKQLTEGVFVTTSDFTDPANQQAARYSALSDARPIRLLDAARFFDALKLTAHLPDYNNWIKDTENLPDFLLCNQLPVYLYDKLPVGYQFGATISEENRFTLSWPSLGPRMMPWVLPNSLAIGSAVNSGFWGHLDDGFDLEEFM